MRILIILIVTLSVFSCSTKKDVLLLQDISVYDSLKIDYIDYKIKVDDILRITVSSQSPELDLIFNSYSDVSNSIETFQINGNQVNSEGDINFAVLGKLKVKDLTTSEISNLITNSLIEKGILINPSVDVKIISSYFTILGEVNKPGRYEFIKNNMDLIQAIGIAGDLTINGKRDGIKILRRTADSFNVANIDLTKSDFIETEYFQIFPGDIIVVDPNSSRVKNAGLIGNAGNLLSVLSFLLTSIILISSG